MSEAKLSTGQYFPSVSQALSDACEMPFVQSDRDKRAVAWIRWGLDTRFRSRYVLAKRLGFSQGHLSKLFGGERGVGIKLFEALSKALDLSMAQLLYDDPAPRYFKPLPGETRRGRRPDPSPPTSQVPATRRRGVAR